MADQNKVTVFDVAKWMAQKLEQEDQLAQNEAAGMIFMQFGEEFVYYNQNGNPAISLKVLDEFKTLTKGTAVWETHSRMWRKRNKYDEPGRKQ